MGPNAKARPRKDYVKYRLKVLKELRIDPPDEETIKKMLDEETMSEIAVDNIFLQIIKNAPIVD